jgi:hypothetical protein
MFCKPYKHLWGKNSTIASSNYLTKSWKQMHGLLFPYVKPILKSSKKTRGTKICFPKLTLANTSIFPVLIIHKSYRAHPHQYELQMRDIN